MFHMLFALACNDAGDDTTSEAPHDSGTTRDNGTGTSTGTGGSGTGNNGGDGSGTGGTTVPVAVDYCHVQWPCSMTGPTSSTSEGVYVQVYEKGVTPGKGQGAGLWVQVGWGPDGSDPDDAWTWSDANYNVDAAGKDPHDLSNDEYQGQFTLPATAGIYDYAGRVTADGGLSWLSCDVGYECGGGGSSDGYSPDQAASLTVK